MSKQETKEKLVEWVVGEGRTSNGKKVLKSKVENVNMQIINNDNFVNLNKHYSLYNNMDRK